MAYSYGLNFSGTLYVRGDMNVGPHTHINSLMLWDSMKIFFIIFILNDSLQIKGFFLEYVLWNICLKKLFWKLGHYK